MRIIKLVEHDILRQYVHLMVEKIRSKNPGIRWDVDSQDVRHVSKFNFAEFKSLDDLDKILNYASNRLELLGSGSSRAVYALTAKKVLKIATNEAGLAQNEEEINVYTNPKSKPLMTKIYDSDKDFTWLTSELAQPCEDNGQIEKHLGIDEENMQFNEFIDACARGQFKWMRENFPVLVPLMPFAEAIYDFIDENNLIPGDIKKPDSWGFTADNRLVLLDYGFSDDVRINHYT